MSARFFYVGTLAFIVAIAVGTVVSVTPAYFLLFLLLGSALAVIPYFYRTASAKLLVATIAVGLLGSGVGLLRAYTAVEKYDTSSLHTQVGQVVELYGQVAREPEERERSIQLFVQVKDSQDIVLVSVDRFSEISYGDVVIVKGRLEIPESFVTDFNRTFLYSEYLKAKGVQFRISFAQVEVLESGEGNIVIASLLSFKKAFVAKLGTVLSEPQSGLGVGLLLGVKRALGEELEEAFRKTGIIHIVVLSGYNVMLVVAFVLFILGTFLPFVARALFGIVAIVLFALLVGLSPTVVRASIMAVLVLLAPLLGRQYNLMRALVVAGCGMILINPYILLYDVGFQLSFLATLGLILVAPQFELLLMRAPNTLKVREFFIATLATQVAVSPLLLYQIGELSLIALVVNVLVLPMVGVAMLLTFITGLMAFVSLPLASIAAVPTHFSLLYIIECARFFAGVPYATVTSPPFPLFLMVTLYGVMGVSWYLVTQRRGEYKESKYDYQVRTNMIVNPIKAWTVVLEDEFVSEVKKNENVSSGSSISNIDTKLMANVSKKEATGEVPIFFR
ncbi:MAG: ComEC/Rec2 family competence protein [Candidatus Paceibacteria bacterium]